MMSSCVKNARHSGLIGLLMALSACAIDRSGQKPENDAGMRDAGRRDAGLRDAGRRDAGVHDSGPPRVDAAPMDADTLDASMRDAVVPDAGTREHGIEARVRNTTCFLNGTPPLAVVPVETADTLKKLDSTGGVGMSVFGSKLVLAERTGRILAFDAQGDGSDATVVLDLSSAVRTDGLRAAAFRPDRKVLIASYLPVDDPLRVVVARFNVSAKGVANPASQQTLLTLPVTDAARAGGTFAFLFDGTLAVAFGDGGDASAPTDPAQLAGKVVRIDVSGTSGYSVPTDNPFVTDPLTLDEIYALDVGAPTSCTVDRVTGRLWCADSGAAARDHILLVSPGTTLRPLLSYVRAGCGAIVGFVSRDAQLPDLQGVLVFGDACTSVLRGMRFDGSLVRSDGDVATLPASLNAFGEDADGHMLAVDANGAVHALVRPPTVAPLFPTTVSATGCITDMATRMPARSLIPFEVRAPLWSDGAKKRRFIVLPGDETIDFTTEGAWGFPAGTMFMKEFLLDDDNDNATPDPIMETRFLIKRSDSAWEGYSYMWDRDRKDAFLLEGAEIERYAMQPGSVDASGADVHRHTFPDRTQCLLCHNAASGRALGLQTGRMNTDHDYDGFTENQLRAMDYAGLFSAPLPDASDALPRFAQPTDESADLPDRARAWLYANCSHCHRPSGPTPVALDLRYETSLAKTNACGLSPMFAIAQIPDAKIIDPGDSSHSELFFRLSLRDQNQMPPIATLITDPDGVDVVRRYIDSLTTCP
jgi:uncharacterized repeat protein (TIGR03806 family)